MSTQTGHAQRSVHVQSARVALSLAALVGASLIGCGGSGAHVERARTATHTGAERRAPDQPHHVSVSAEGLSPCDLQLLASLEPQPTPSTGSSPPLFVMSYLLSIEDLERPPVGLDLRRLIQRLSRGPHSLSLGLSQADSAEIERAGERRDLLLAQARRRLKHKLTALGWERARPLPMLWRPTHYLRGAPPLSLTPQEWLAHDWTVQLSVRDPETTSPPAPSLLERLSNQLRPLRGEGGIIEVPKGERCTLLQRVKVFKRALDAHQLTSVPLEGLLASQLSRLEHPRLALTQRPPISEGCAQLLGLSSSEDPAIRNGARWSLVISSRRGASGDHSQHLSLPLPHRAQRGLPSWEETPALSAIWARRHLWWGARACLTERVDSELLSPVSSLTLQLPRGAHRDQLTLSKLSSARGLSHLPSLAQTMKMEQRMGVSLTWRGVLGELWPNRVAMRELDELVGVAVYYAQPDADPSAAMLISARPLRPYRLLAHLTGEPAFSTLAYHQLTFAGPLLMLPSQSGWRAPLQLKTSRQSTLIAQRALSIAPPREGWSLFGRAPTAFTLKLSDVQSVYGGRGRVKRALKLGGGADVHVARSGELWRVDGGRLGVQRRRLNLPAGARGAMGEDRAR